MKLNFCLLACILTGTSISIFSQKKDSSGYSVQTYQVLMRDNITLATEVLIPKVGEQRLPVIFVRTPYGKSYQTKVRAHYIKNGYAIVVQDCRGTGESKGKFEPYLHEKEDGYDALDWISKQPWCNGNVGMIGASYEGQVQWLAAAGGHPALKTIIPQVSGTDPFLDVPYDHGILKLSMIEWAFKMSYPDKQVNDYILEKLYTLPVSKIDDAFFGSDIALWNSWTNMYRVENWSSARFLEDFRKVNIPVLYVSGNWDVEALSTQINWLKMKSFGKKNQHLLFGPWEHNAFVNEIPTKFSGIEYGAKSKLNFEAIWLRWFDHWLKGVDNGVEKEKSAKLFITGLNDWIYLNDWPDKKFSKVEYAFNLSEQLNQFYKLKAGNELSTKVEYTYSPAKVKINMDPEFSETSYYKLDEDVKDHIALTTEPFEKDAILTGPSYVDLEFSIDQADIDFFILIAEVDSSGQIKVLSHPGKVRATFRDNKQLLPVKSGGYYNVKIDLFPVTHQFKKGSRLAIIIRSDWFPRYIRNLGTDEPIATATISKEVKVTITSNSKLVLNKIEPQD